jgi:hypothetical protein
MVRRVWSNGVRRFCNEGRFGFRGISMTKTLRVGGAGHTKGWRLPPGSSGGQSSDTDGFRPQLRLDHAAGLDPKGNLGFAVLENLDNLCDLRAVDENFVAFLHGRYSLGWGGWWWPARLGQAAGNY